MSHPLISARSKLRRAKEHIHVLNGEIREFMATDPYTIVQEYDDKAGEEVFYMAVWEQPPSLGWGVLVGDALHNLRSSLDHIAFVLAENFGTGGTPQTEFPIFRCPNDFREKAPRKIAAITNHEARTRIEKMQPFATGQNPEWCEPLWTLQELSNIDKHRFIHLTGATTVDLTPEFYGAVPPDSPPTMLPKRFTPSYIWAGGPFHESTIVARVPVPPETYMHMYTGVHPYIAFPEGSPAQGEYVIQVLESIASTIERVFRELLGLFKDHPDQPLLQ